MNMVNGNNNNSNNNKKAPMTLRIAVAAIATIMTVAIFASYPSYYFGPSIAAFAQQQDETASPLGEKVHIVRDATGSYSISDGSSMVGSFDTTYTIVGKNNVLVDFEDLIISTITSDFNSSATVGYVTVNSSSSNKNSQDDAATAAGNNTTTTTVTTTLPNPFASSQQIEQKITEEIQGAIADATENLPMQQEVEVRCDFGTMLEEFKCSPVETFERTI